MEYRIVYDVVREGPTFWLSAVCGIVTLPGALLVYGLRRETTPRTERGMLMWIPYGLLTICVLGTMLTTHALVGDWRAAKHAMQTGTALAIEGVVHVPDPSTAPPRAAESFMIDRRAYGFAEAGVAVRYARPLVGSGVVRDGQYVRIHEHGGRVLRVEVARDERQRPMLTRRSASPAVPCAIGAIFMLVCFRFTLYLSARLSGWHALAQCYPGVRLEDADGYLLATARVSPSGIVRNLALRVSDTALSMVPTFPFAFFHDVVVIPWHAVERMTPYKSFLVEGTVITLTKGKWDVTVHGRAGRAAIASYQRWREAHR